MNKLYSLGIDVGSTTVQERLKDLIECKYAGRLEDEDGVKKVKNALVRNGYSYKDVNIALEEFLNDEES